MSEIKTTRLYRVENPSIKNANPDSVVSYQDTVGQWFTPNIDTTALYLRKSTQTFGRDASVVDGAQLVVVDVPTSKIKQHHVSQHPIASTMDVENDNYIVPIDAGYSRIEVPLDDVLGELRGGLAKFDQMAEAKNRLYKIAKDLGKISLC